MRVDKYYGTDTFMSGERLNKLIYLGFNGHHHQFRIVCKAKSKAEANRIAKELGVNFYRKTFSDKFTSETGNKIELEMCDKYGFIICTEGTMGNNYIDIREVL